MEAQKIIAGSLILLSFSSSSFSQTIEENRTGNLRAQGNLAGGYLFSQKDFTAYLAGDFDLFIDNSVSATGEGWYNFKTNDDANGLVRNHSIFGGLNYHPVKEGKWDPYIGLSPGVAIAEVRYDDSEAIKHTTGVAPLVSGVIGCNYYIGSIFHLFVKARAVAGRFRGDASEFTSLNEMKITAGLGWNVRLWKKKG